MASYVYPLFKDAMALNTKAFDLDSDTIKACLLGSAYTYSAAHDEYADWGANVIGTPTALAGISVTAGVVDTTDATTTFAAVTGAEVGWIGYYDDSLAGDPVLAIADIANFTPSGENVVVTWDNGASKLFVI